MALHGGSKSHSTFSIHYYIIFFTNLLHCWLNLQPITVPLLYFKYVYIHISLCILLMWIWTANWVLYSLIPVATGFSVQFFCNVLQPFLLFLKHDTTSDEARFKFHFFPRLPLLLDIQYSKKIS